MEGKPVALSQANVISATRVKYRQTRNKTGMTDLKNEFISGLSRLALKERNPIYPKQPLTTSENQNLRFKKGVTLASRIFSLVYGDRITIQSWNKLSAAITINGRVRSRYRMLLFFIAILKSKVASIAHKIVIQLPFNSTGMAMVIKSNPRPFIN